MGTEAGAPPIEFHVAFVPVAGETGRRSGHSTTFSVGFSTTSETPEESVATALPSPNTDAPMRLVISASVP